MKPTAPSGNSTRSSRRTTIGGLEAWKHNGKQLAQATSAPQSRPLKRFSVRNRPNLRKRNAVGCKRAEQRYPRTVGRALPETTPRQSCPRDRALPYRSRVTIAVRPAEQTVDVEIRWAGGFESRHHYAARPVTAYVQLDDFDRMCARLGDFACAGPDWRAPRIAAQLNAEGFQTPKQHGAFTADVVRFLYRSNFRVCPVETKPISDHRSGRRTPWRRD